MPDFQEYIVHFQALYFSLVSGLLIHSFFLLDMNVSFHYYVFLEKYHH